MQLIPAIDLLDGDIVRLRQGDYARRTVYPLPPRELAERWRGAGATQLHIVDLNAARGDATDNLAIVFELAKLRGFAVQCAGGVRDEVRLRAMLDAGAARVVIGSLAVREPDLVLDWLRGFGSDRLVLALDVNTVGGVPQLAVNGWRERTDLSLWPLLARYADAGLRHLLCTDIARDGMLSGSNVALYGEILGRHPQLELQASGGVSGLDDIAMLKAAGVTAAILGRALLDERLALRQAMEAAA